MTLFDWCIVLFLNGPIIAYGLYLARGTTTSGEWFLARRALPWWAVGLSMFATNVDNADLVGVTSQCYTEGIHVISVYSIGSAAGGILAAFFIVPAIARRGFYTNAEYLEARFGPSARVLSALIQIQYRTSMLGMMVWSAYLILTQLVEMPPAAAWALIFLLVVLAGIYTAWGGLKSVVFTDSAQGIVMMVAAVVIFTSVWNAVGGWSTLQTQLATMQDASGKSLSKLAHISGFRGDHDAVSPYLIALGWTIIGCGYWTVNHTQTMRLMGARSFWDMRMAAVFGVALSLPVMIISALLGLFGRGAELPAMKEADQLYPLLAKTFLGPGLKGLVVAGVVAAVVSTFDSMGSALSAIFTRDVYARLIARDRSDRHYVFVGRLATAGVLLIGFAYLPFIWKQEHMLKAFTTLIPVFVTPLFTMYMLGVFTRVHRTSGVVGLVCGGIYGVIALIDRQFTGLPWIPDFIYALPTWFTERWVALLWSVLFTAAPMVLTTLILGKEPPGSEDTFREQGWLDRSREALAPLPNRPAGSRLAHWLHPLPWAALLVVLCLWVTFWVFW
jgi:SSS family solute:Na+ symporter